MAACCSLVLNIQELNLLAPTPHISLAQINQGITVYLYYKSAIRNRSSLTMLTSS